MGCRLPLAKNQQRGRAKDEHKKEKFIPDNRTDDRHFRLAGRQPLRFAQLVQTAERQLEGNEHQDDAGRGKEPLQRHTQGALKEQDPDRDGRRNAGDRADPGLEARGGHFHRS
jgi:hypothetical protein